MSELTNSLRKTYASLSTPKGRRETGLFMTQGNKCVCDTIDNFAVEALIATEQWIDRHQDICSLHKPIICRPVDLQKISTLNTTPEVIAIYKIPQTEIPQLNSRLVVALDCIQDPGNLGTIIRVADWMGVDTILASYDTVDVWNPKVIQATMGAISRVTVHYCDLAKLLRNSTPIYGTFLDGENIYSAELTSTGIIVMGNEGKGISSEISSFVTRRLTIPSYPPGAATSESLNVAIASAITLAEFRRR